MISYQQGAKIIKEFVQTLPTTSGVYHMLGAEDKVLYVGKAKNLKARVISYTRENNLNTRIMRMVSLTVKMRYIDTKTEAEAFLLEADMIKSLKPHFNILLKDDKTYPYILIRKDHPFPQIIKHRGAKSIKGKYFGPFASARSVYQTLEILQKAFLLRTCTDHVFANRSRPCLLHQIKRCSAPCTQEISSDDYLETVKMTERFLKGEGKIIIKDMSEKMYVASQNMDYEVAAEYRDRLSALSHIRTGSNFHPETFSEADIIALYQKDGAACIHIIFIRAGQNWGHHSYFPHINKESTPQEIINGFIGQFYQNKPCPKRILLSHAPDAQYILKEALGEKYDVKLEIEVPQRGEKYKFIQKSLKSAEEALAKKKIESRKQEDLLEALGILLEIDTPKRIEIYDNAHISGAHALGAMVVMTAAGFNKKQYRSWNIKDASITDGDDYAMMKEVLSRRFKRLKEEGLENSESVPDLIILDGGQGQLSTVLKVAFEYNIDIPIIAVAKGEDRNAGRERFFIPNKKPFGLPLNDPTLYFVQRMRDEAHRFANGLHGKKRDKVKSDTALGNIAGVGSARKKSLMAKFGSIRAIKEATLQQIEQTPNISKKMAKNIYDYFKDE